MYSDQGQISLHYYLYWLVTLSYNNIATATFIVEAERYVGMYYVLVTACKEIECS